MAASTAGRQRGFLHQVLAADVQGHAFNKAYEYSHIALAGAAIPAVFAKGSFLQKITDYTLALAIPVHSHFSLNALVTDYFPMHMRPIVRGGVLGLSVVTFLGLTKLTWTGPGLCAVVKSLWSRPPQKTAA